MSHISNDKAGACPEGEHKRISVMSYLSCLHTADSTAGCILKEIVQSIKYKLKIYIKEQACNKTITYET